MEEIVQKLKYLEYPFTIKDLKLFYESINSPTQIRYNAMEWLFSLMDKESIESLLTNNYTQEEKIILLFQLFNLDETKDNILGYSTEINNTKTFINLLNFVIKYINIKNNKNIFNQELELANKLIDVIDKNKVDLFKKNIRLFINDINNHNANNDINNKINVKKINDDINNCKLLIEKVEKKLEKLNNIEINEESIGETNIYDKLEFKKCLNIFEKNLDEFLVDFNNFYEKELKYLEYPFTIQDMKLFYESINSPTQIRYNAIEWLFSLMDKESIEQLLTNNYTQEEKIILLFQLFNLDETKDDILGYSTEINNTKTFINLLNFTIKYINIKNNKNIFNQELELANKLIDVIDKNKIDLFKKNIRLFINDINNHNINNNIDNKINVKKINDDINNCKLLIEKVEKKLEKLNQIELNEENIEEKNIYDKLEFKKCLIIFEKNLDEFLIDFNNYYEKELKYINPDNISHLDERNTELLNQYKKIENVASILEEMFSIHNKIIKN